MDFYLNNTFHSINEPVLVSDHRGAFFGDGLFETIRVFNQSIPFINDHIGRLLAGMHVLGMDIPEHFTPIYFHTKIKELVHRNVLLNARIRLTVMRRGKGRYGPQKRSVDWMIHAEALEGDRYALNTRGLQLTIFDEMKKPLSNLSNIKSTSAAFYTMAAMYNRKMAKDDCVILNALGRVAEAQASNIFGIKDEVFYTPLVSEGGVAGVIRKNLIELLKDQNYEVYEEEIEVANLFEMDSIFITNSIQGVQWVQALDTHEFSIGNIPQLLNLLNDHVSST